jgi:hypothetical protein
MLKVHFKGGCGRGGEFNTVDTPHRVSCLFCRDTQAFLDAVQAYKEKVEADFAAQTPRHVRQLWNNENIDCRNCGGDLFRERPRSLLSFHFVCEGCGTSVHPPTETGMST